MKTLRTSQFAPSSALAAASKPYFRTGLVGLTLLMAAATSTVAQAQPERPVHTKQTDTALMLTIDNPTLQRVQVRVVQLGTSHCLSNEVNRQASYGSKLNFDKLPTGEYAVLMRVGRERYRYAVQVQAQPQRSTIVVRELSTPTEEKTLASATF